MLATDIIHRLDDFWGRIGNLFVATTSKQIWFDLGVDNPELGGRFGWCWPAPYSDPAQPDMHYLVGYCPELIAEMIAHLEDEERSDYLDAVEYLSSMFLADIERCDDPSFRDELFEAFATNFPASAQLVEEVEERAIALGIVPSDPGGEPARIALCVGCGYMNPDGSMSCVLCGASI